VNADSTFEARLVRTSMAACIVLGPLTTLIEVVFLPGAPGMPTAESIAAIRASNPLANAIHLVFDVAAGYFLPLGFVGLALVAWRGSPRLATIGGAIVLIGTLPAAVFVGQDDLGFDMAAMPDDAQFAALGDRFNADAVMTFYFGALVLSLVIGLILLAVALGRARLIPTWAAAALVISVPFQLLGFPLHHPVLGEAAAAGLRLIGSAPAAVWLVRLSRN
jgi:hypothetical protein